MISPPGRAWRAVAGFPVAVIYSPGVAATLQPSVFTADNVVIG
jgi:hypothetical protein